MLTSLTKTSEKITGLKMGADEYLNKPFNTMELLARADGILRRNRQAIAAHPVTRLPGKGFIEEQVRSRLEAGTPFLLLFAAINNLKGFVDLYGHDRGDDIMRMAANILREGLEESGADTGRIGHIGGTQFALVSDGLEMEAMTDHIVQSFDTLILNHYDEEARTLGFITTRDRTGQEIKVPLMTVSIGVVRVEPSKFADHSQVEYAAQDALRQAQSKSDSDVVVFSQE
jgi:diguanylate cyclase (GGDEF)-like protein